jgi:hypothetical protein
MHIKNEFVAPKGFSPAHLQLLFTTTNEAHDSKRRSLVVLCGCTSSKFLEADMRLIVVIINALKKHISYPSDKLHMHMYIIAFQHPASKI